MSRADRMTLRNRLRAGELKSRTGKGTWRDHPLNKERRRNHERVVKQQRR